MALDVLRPDITFIKTGYLEAFKSNHGGDGENIIFLDGQ
jgi:hypothetical protein